MTWSYKILKVRYFDGDTELLEEDNQRLNPTDLFTRLTSLGNSGWELMSIIATGDDEVKIAYFTFKRQD